MATVLISGGTGMVGKRLTKMLIEKGYEVIILSRKSGIISHEKGISFANWNVEHQTIDKTAIAKADYIIHLAGAGVADKRWSKKRKKEIVDSRTNSSALIVKALKEMPNQVKAVVSASAIGWYGPDTAESLQFGFKENAKADSSYLGDTCKLWEESIEPVIALNKRLVKLRIGIVLSNDGGALLEFKKPLKAGLATILGNGAQIVSWIHEDDLCRMFIHAIENEEMNGSYNAVASQPVSNKELTLTLAKKMRGQFFIPIMIPAFILKIMLGEMSIEVLKSANVNNDKIKSTGFSFLFPTIDAALHHLIKK
jgi:hypothetical protein